MTLRGAFFRIGLIYSGTPSMKLMTTRFSSSGTTVIEKEVKRIRHPSPLYKVLLHNDPINSMDYVVSSLLEVVPQLSEQGALAVMLEAHNTGIGLVIVCDLEPAEFYCESLKAKGLTSTIEKET